ncbi:helix-turn-helix domain-containing protein [Confluentibacter sediminis]|uniref:helix-turn-helix domain-containing protein n=1 Tax=Confluentibacter sediminis TaxID=2219045 RepID=UPI000DAD9D2C|nr:XRE family transcriptional regulator [Confluentibacter sediminis]
MNTIGDKIKELRSLMGYSLQDLASMVNVSKAAIQQYENGSTTPSNIVLKNIATAFGINVWDFFKTPVINYGLDSVKFRDGHTLFDKKKEETLIKKDVIKYVRNYIELESILDNNVKFENPISDFLITSYSDVEKAVKKIRRKWKLGNSPIDSICDLIESKGVKVVSINRNIGSGGLSGWIEDIPVIIVNDYFEHTRETTRRRFTLLHELGHILMKLDLDSITEDIEEYYCNRFAAAFLLVDEAAVEYFGKNRTSISLGELKEIKLKYGISIKAIIYRMNSLKLIDDDIKDMVIKDYEIWQDGREDFGEYTKSDEKPKRFKFLLRSALTEKRIEKNKASELSNIPIDKLNELTIKNFNLN